MIASIAFIIFKIPHLSLPYYWDEAWVYGPAVRLMERNGLSLLPDALPVYYSRGHPLLFHFLAGAWLKIFGNTIFSSHVFALFISIMLIAAVYIIGSRLFNKTVATVSVLLLLLQPIFLAQSALVLPEVMLGFFALLSIYFYLRRQMVLYFIFGTLMLFTKETGIAFVFIAFILEIIYQRKNIISRPWMVFKKLFIAGSPVLVFILFLIIQYSYNGWFFFPEHTNFVTFEPGVVFNRFVDGLGAYIFIYQGRNLLFFFSILILIYGLVRKIKFEFKNELFALLLFIIGFMLVSSVNFFANRYVLCVIPLVIMLTLGIIFQVIKNKYLITGFVLLAIGLQIRILDKQSNSDHNLGYINAVKVNIEMIEYCNSLNINNNEVFTYFITRGILSNPLAGYVSEDEIYTNLRDKFSLNYDYYIFSSYDTPKEEWELRNDSNLILVKRFENRQAWIELYSARKKTPITSPLISG